MINYDQMSNYEINKDVALQLFSVDEEDLDESSDGSGSCVIEDEENFWGYYFNPIDLWEDCGKIILKSGTTLMQLADKNWLAISPHEIDEVTGKSVRRHSHTHENPLRAICVVFLMMNGAKDE